MTKVAIYVRVSTDKQSTDMQLAELEAYAKARDWDIVGVYRDVMSGTSEKRPELDQMLHAAARREFDIIAVWKLDRFSRSLKHLVTTLADLKTVGVTFVSLKDNLDLTTSAGTLMFNMLGAFAEFEASLIKERVRGGLAMARTKGVKLGPPIRLDYKQVKALREKGMSLKAIGRELGASASGIRKVLNRT